MLTRPIVPAAVSRPLPALPRHGPPLVIAPPWPDLEVSQRNPLSTKAQRLHEPQGRLIAGLYVGLDSVKSVHAKRPAHDRTQPLRHEALACVPRVGVEAEVRRLEHAPDDLAEVDDTHELPGVATPEEVGNDHALPATAKVQAPALVRLRHVHPRAMQSPARTSQLEELGRSRLLGLLSDTRIGPATSPSPPLMFPRDLARRNRAPQCHPVLDDLDPARERQPGGTAGGRGLQRIESAARGSGPRNDHE